MSTTENVAFSVEVPRKMYDDLKALARREDSSLARETRIALRWHLDRNKPQRGHSVKA